MLRLVKLEFSTEKTGVRKANIIAKNQEDGLNFIRSLYPANKNKITGIMNIEDSLDVHAYTDYALDYISKKTSGKLEEDTTSTAVYTCPWCDKKYEKAHGLKVHIGQEHKKVE